MFKAGFCQLLDTGEYLINGDAECQKHRWKWAISLLEKKAQS